VVAIVIVYDNLPHPGRGIAPTISPMSLMEKSVIHLVLLLLLLPFRSADHRQARSRQRTTARWPSLNAVEQGHEFVATALHRLCPLRGRCLEQYRHAVAPNPAVPGIYRRIVQYQSEDQQVSLAHADGYVVVAVCDYVYRHLVRILSFVVNQARLAGFV